MSRRLEKSKQGRGLKVINQLRNQGVESNGDSHPQFEESQPVGLAAYQDLGAGATDDSMLNVRSIFPQMDLSKTSP
ncbi:hypothetical protein [Limnospira platensis]|uniref:hypothetical protein n=1 Tax=Limnospira platensis TaxID=118562 RepID=UPI003D6E0159